jgi:hypothetical protein
MKKLKKIFLVLALGSLMLPLLNSCHKYPEDPFISLKNPGKRLNGTWKFTGYRINGTDHNHDFDSFLAPFTLTDCKIEFVAQTDKASKYLSGIYHIYNGDGSEIKSGADYDLRSDANDITFACDTAFRGHLLQATITNPQLSVARAIWDIKELYQKSLHIKLNNVDMYLKKQ